MNGPIAQEALLSFALPSSSALRPSMSRRLTSLPSVAPTMRARLSTASTISGSGLFQCDDGCRPTPLPKPTADIGCDLVKTSASGPMPTSMYCDQKPRRTRSSFRRPAASDARLDRRQVGAEGLAELAADLLGALRVAAGALLDHPLQQADGEGDAAGLDRLQVARREQRGRAVRRGPGQRLRHQLRRAAEAVAGHAAQEGGEVGAFQQVGDGRRRDGDVEHLAASDDDDARALGGRTAPDAPDQQGAVDVGRQQGGGRDGLHAVFPS